MKKKVKLKIISNIVHLDSDDEDIEIFTEGELYTKRNKIYITYEESEISGMEGSKTVLIIKGNDEIEMIRYGQVKSKMRFLENKETNTKYKTQYGIFNMVINTREIKVNIDLEELKGNIKLLYNLEIKGLSKGKNTLKLQII